MLSFVVKRAVQLTSTCEYVFPTEQGYTTACIYILGQVQVGTSVSKDAYMWQFHSHDWHFGSISQMGAPFRNPLPAHGG